MELVRFDTKELRQIEHFLEREMGEDYLWYVQNPCECGECPRLDAYVRAKSALADSTVHKKIKEMAHKYNLHIRIERDTGRIWATKKGVNDVKVSGIQERR